jgi:hypothetical protein
MGVTEKAQAILMSKVLKRTMNNIMPKNPKIKARILNTFPPNEM